MLVKEIEKPITYRQWTGVDIPEINITIRTVYVGAMPRQLRGEWHPEMAQDFAAAYHFDGVVEIAAMLAAEIGAAVDNYIFNRVTIFGTLTGSYQIHENLVINKPKRFLFHNFIVE
jgi:hypothetical protein